MCHQRLLDMFQSITQNPTQQLVPSAWTQHQSQVFQTWLEITLPHVDITTTYLPQQASVLAKDRSSQTQELSDSKILEHSSSQKVRLILHLNIICGTSDRLRFDWYIEIVANRYWLNILTVGSFSIRREIETVVVTSYSRFIISTPDILIQFLFYSYQVRKSRK